MADIQLDTQSKPATPSASTGVLYLDTTAKELINLDDAGSAKVIRTLTNQGLTTTNGADIYIVGSAIAIPPALARVGAQFIWQLIMSKTAACTSAPVYNIRVGTAGSVADTARVTWTSTLNQTAATDSALLTIMCTVKTAGASGVLSGGMALQHKNTATGFANAQVDVGAPTDSAAFDLTVASSIVGLSINPGNTGANGVWTITTLAQGLNL